jgi:hypothetical protein
MDVRIATRKEILDKTKDGSIQNHKEAKLHNTQSVFFYSKFYISYFIIKLTIYRALA